MQKEILPHSEKPRQVWLLAKHSYFLTGVDYPLGNETLLRASKELNIEFVSAFEHNEKEDEPYPAGVTNLGKGHMLPQKDFEAAVVKTLAIVGLG